MVDSTFRWSSVVVLAVLYLACLIPGSYRKGFPRRPRLQSTLVAIGLIAIGLLLATLFGESVIDAALLRAQFGYVRPETGIYGYGWALVFGYSILLANIGLTVVGEVMIRTGRTPPWIDRKSG